jgi:iron complex transport system permease protein
VTATGGAVPGAGPVPGLGPAVPVPGGAPRLGRAVARFGPLSVSWRPRALAVPVALTVLALPLAVLSAGVGDYPLAPAEVLGALGGSGDDLARVVVLELRLPRIAAALLVGLALGASGAITQAMARNPLASPDILGVTAGASAAAVLLIVATGAGLGGFAVAPGAGLIPVAALAGGLAAALAGYALAWRAGIDPLRLVLVGIGLSAMLTALTTWLLVAATIVDAGRATVWLTGSLGNVDPAVLPPLLGTVVIAGAVAAAATFSLRALTLGDDLARGLGVRVPVVRTVLVLAAVALAAGAVAVAGPITFVALAAPQIAMRLTRSATPPVLAGAATGGVLLLAADLIARVALPVELPVGVVTAVLGAPFLLYLLARRTGARS